MSRYSDEILTGLDAIPLPDLASSLIVTGRAQPIISYKTGDTILAGYKYGRGSVLVGTNKCFCSWFFDPYIDQNIEQLLNNIKYWLTGDEHLEDSQIVNIRDAVNSNQSFSNYSILLWDFEYEINDVIATNLLAYLEQGGALMCAGTVWKIMLENPNKKLEFYTAYKLINNYFGIFYKANSFDMPNEMNLEDNKEIYSHFDEAITIFDRDRTENRELYFDTIERSLETLFNEGVIGIEKISLIRDGLIQDYASFLHIMPSEENPVVGDREQNICRLLARCYTYSKDIRAPAIDSFPFDFKDNELQQEYYANNVPLTFNTNFSERLSTGYYLPAGINIIINVTGGDITGWVVRIGAHDDNLGESEDIEEYKRWPVLTCSRKLARNMSFSSPFGGLVYFESPGPGSLSVYISHVVESPYIDLTKPETINDWERRGLAPGLWSELAGENVIFTIPSAFIRDVLNAVEIVQYWDKVVEAHHQLRGTNPKNFKRERIVNDLQPMIGYYMHSGYPIVTELDLGQLNHEESIINIEILRKYGHWGLFHELGHNMQREPWDFEGSEEVTCNIFAIHAMQIITGRDILEIAWLLDQRDKFYPFFQNPNYEEWKINHGIAIFLFAQLLKHFGWKPMYQFFRDYENDISSKSLYLPQNNQHKIDNWVIRYSNLIQRNLKPHFEMYGLPVSQEVNNYIQQFPNWVIYEERDPNVFFS